MSVEQGGDPWLPRGTEWPLLFSYRMVVDYQGIVVSIELSGRATAYVNHEDGSVWIDGVNPGAFAACGNNMEKAEEDLRDTLSGVFRDIADASEQFTDFEQQAKEFLYGTDDETIAEWEAALARVRKGAEGGGLGLPRRHADDNPPYVQITRDSTDPSSTPLLLPDEPKYVALATAA